MSLPVRLTFRKLISWRPLHRVGARCFSDEQKPGGYFARHLGRGDDGDSQPFSMDWTPTQPFEDVPEPIPGGDYFKGGQTYIPEELNWVDRPEKKKTDHRSSAPEESCRGKRQRHGFKAATCNLMDLDDLHYTNILLLEYFVNEAGAIKPRKQSGLCAKCQRKVRKTIKLSRHMGIIPYIQDWNTVDKTANLGDVAKSGRYDRETVISLAKKA